MRFMKFPSQEKPKVKTESKPQPKGKGRGRRLNYTRPTKPLLKEMNKTEGEE